MPSKWIWLPDCTRIDLEESVFVYFRTEFMLASIPDSCKLRITADSRYKLFINGCFVEAGPRKGNQHAWYVDEIQLLPWLHKGKNIIAIEVLHYPVAVEKGNFSVFRTVQPGLYLASDHCALIDLPWKCAIDGKRHIVQENPWFSPLMIYEETEGDAALHGWKIGNYDDSTWFPAFVLNRSKLPQPLQNTHLQDRPIPFLRRLSRRFSSIVSVHSSSPNQKQWQAWIDGQRLVTIPPHVTASVDICAEALTTGYLYCSVSGGKGAKLTLLQAECYAKPHPNGGNDFDEMPLKGDRTATVGTDLFGYSDVYVCHGQGTETIPECLMPFWFRTFRYIRLTIETQQEPLTLQDLHYEEVSFPYQAASRVKTSDPSMDEIWDISERTLMRCMHETYEDCPFYEQLQYTMDTRSQMLFTYASAADDRLARQCMEDFRHASHPDGLLNSCYPNVGLHVIPGFSIYYIGMLYDHMMYFGDRNLLRQHMSTVDGILNYFEGHLNAQGIVDKIGGKNLPMENWSFIDWTKEWDKTDGVPPATLCGPIAMESLLYILGLQYAAAIANELQQPEKKETYLRRMKACQAAIQRTCIGKNGMLQDGPGVEEYSQHAQVFGVLTDTLNLEAGRAALLSTLDHPEKYAQCSVAMMYYLFRALEKCGLYDRTEKLWNLWRKMLAKHLTTCEEEPVRSRSDCHAWGSLALYELPAAILGVRPLRSGCSLVSIQPQASYLSFASGEAVLPGGKIRVDWKRNQKPEVYVQGTYTLLEKNGKYYAKRTAF